MDLVLSPVEANDKNALRSVYVKALQEAREIDIASDYLRPLINLSLRGTSLGQRSKGPTWETS